MQLQNTISENPVNQQWSVVAFEEWCWMRRGKRGSKHVSWRTLCEAPVEQQHKNNAMMSSMETQGKKHSRGYPVKVTLFFFFAYIVHFPWWKSIRRSKNFKEIVCPKVVPHIAENDYPEICLWKKISSYGWDWELSPVTTIFKETETKIELNSNPKELSERISLHDPKKSKLETKTGKKKRRKLALTQ